MGHDNVSFRSRMEGYVGEDVGLLTDPTSLVEAGELLLAAYRRAPGGEAKAPQCVDPRAVAVTAHFHVFRAMEATVPDRGRELHAAGVLLAAAYHADPASFTDESPLPLEDIPMPGPEAVASHALAAHAGAVLLVGEQESNAEVIASAERAYAAAAALAPIWYGDLYEIYWELAIARRLLFDLTGSLAHVTAAVEAGRKALELTSVGDPQRFKVLSTLAQALRTRYERTGERSDVDEAIGLSRKALAGRTQSPETSDLLANLSFVLQARAEYAGSVRDTDDAVKAAQEAVALRDKDHANRWIWLWSLGSAHLQRVVRTGQEADARASAEACRSAVALAPPEAPQYVDVLSTLAGAEQAVFTFGADPAVLDRAVEAAGEVARRELTETHKAHYNHAVLLLSRYRFTGRLSDLTASIAASEHAYDALPEEAPPHPDAARVAMVLGHAYALRADTTSESEDATIAVRILAAAVDSTPPDSVDHPALVGAFAQALMTRFQVHERMGLVGSGILVEADLDVAVNAATDAVSRTSEDHPDLAKAMSVLGSALRLRAVLTSSREDLVAAIAAGERAVNASFDDDSPELCDRLLDLGRSLTLAVVQGDADTDGRGRSALRRAAGMRNATAYQRLQAAQQWAERCALIEDWAGVTSAVEEAAQLLRIAAWHGLDLQDRAHVLHGITELVGVAGAACLERNELAQGVALLEQIRGVLVGHALDARSDRSRLRACNQELADRLDSLRSALDTIPPPGTQQSEQVGAWLRVRERLAGEWDDAVEQVRLLPEFDDFLLPPDFAELAAAAHNGPVVMLLVSRRRCDALVIRPGDAVPLAVPLTEVTYDDVVEQASRLDDVLRNSTTGGPAELAVESVLEWTWRKIAAPVLDRLGLRRRSSPDAPWPRLWWCPTGPSVFLPLHAAGESEAQLVDAAAGELARSVPDCVVSSYTPTLRALADAQTRAATPAPASRVLAVAVPNAPDLPRLPFTAAEVAAVAEMLPAARVLQGRRATRRQILQGLRQARIFHFAGHAGQDPRDPFGGCLYTDDHLTDGPIETADLARTPVGEGSLAFLSACETFRHTPHAPDENLHLAGAVHLAGFIHVIGTYWRVADNTSADVVREVYRLLRRRTFTGRVRLELGGTALALHHAVRAVRDAGEPALHWAPYAHQGP
ncbi:CHAT domain-containing protein [Streptomyces antibioticus]|uniref:CHAT domain-containing tetratricopeptide repeat protein n=1 Tax=Streptomyces antibioticus TaxID=1890 RepID=UPI0033D96BCD